MNAVTMLCDQKPTRSDPLVDQYLRNVAGRGVVDISASLRMIRIVLDPPWVIEMPPNDLPE